MFPIGYEVQDRDEQDPGLGEVDEAAKFGAGKNRLRFAQVVPGEGRIAGAVE
jgi:hypothetical protein